MTSSKVKIKPVGGKNSDAIEVFPVDAKEAVTAGTHEYVGQDLGEAEWIKPSNKKGSKKAKKEAAEDTDSEETEEVDIEAMGSKEIEAFVEENGIKIKGFDAMGLVKKRKALTEYLENQEESEEESEL